MAEVRATQGALRRLFRPANLLLIVVLAVGGSVLVSHLRAKSADATTCIDHYNAMVMQAKAALIRGDRTGAVNSLVAAKEQLRRCQVPSPKEVGPDYRD